MRYTIFFVFIILIISIFFCSIFLYTENSKQNPVLAYEDFNAKILDNQSNIKNPVSEQTYSSSFPESKNKEFLPPKLKEGAILLDQENMTSFVMDKKSGAILLKQNENRKTPIASISKLATALVFLDRKIDWEKTYQVKAGDMVGGGKENIAIGQKIKLKDLFFLSLVDSDNSATVALAHSTGMSNEEFMKKLKEKFIELEMANTSFGDLTGLSDNNISTAKDVAKLAKAAFAKKEIREATLTKRYEWSDGKKHVYNTDILLDIFPQNGIKIVGGKTGFTTSAGYCFVGQFTDNNGHEIISVVLGLPDINSRFEETKKLVHWTYDNYIW